MKDELKEFFFDLERLGTRGIRCGLERIKMALPFLDLKLDRQRFIHITGTNGKGSVCYLITQILSHSGYRVGLTVSPHVNDYRERIQFATPQNPAPTLIAVEKLLTCHQELKSTLPQNHELTYFEWNILLALLYFSKAELDFIIIETGLGGRLDATNICPSLISGITTIGIDHTEYLGNTLQSILAEKLQIAKPAGDFLFGPVDEALKKIAREHCREVGANFFSLHDVFDLNPKVIGKIHFFNLAPGAVKQSYMKENIRYALGLAKLVEHRGFTVDYDSFFSAPQIVLPPARLEVIANNPLLILDGAHNEQGVTALKEYLDSTFGVDYILAFGCLANRNFAQLANILRSPHLNLWLMFDGYEHTTPVSVYEQVQRLYGGERHSLNDKLRVRLTELRKKENKPVVVAGSLYLCSQFKKWFKGSL